MSININNIDFKINPQDDFYHFCNGKWIANNKIPEKYSIWNIFTQLNDKNKLKIKKIIKECKNSNQHISQLINTMYENGMNTTKRNKQDIEYIVPFLNKINNLSEKKDISKIVSLFHQNGLNCLFYIYNGADSKESTINRLHLAHSYLGLPNKDYYTKKKFESIRKEYKSYLYKLLKPIKDTYKLDKNYQDQIFDFEKNIASLTLSEANKRNSIKRYHKINLNQFCKKHTYFDWRIYFNDLDIYTTTLIYDDFDFYKGIDNFIKNKSIDEWKNYFYYCLLDSLSSYLSDYYVNLHFNFYGKILSGKKIKEPKWETNVNIVNSYLDDAIGELFVKKHFDNKSKDYVEK